MKNLKTSWDSSDNEINNNFDDNSNYFLPQESINKNLISNPFDSGIKRAIAAARESFGMEKGQEDRALRKSLLAFGNNIGQEPKQSGLLKNFGSIARSLSPAIIAHDEAEEEAIQSNNALANQLLAYENQEKEQRAKEEEREFRRLLEMQKFEASKDYNNRFLDLKQISENESINNSISEFIPFTNKRDSIPYLKDKKALGSSLADLEKVKQAYFKLKNKYGDNFLPPISGYSKLTNPVKDFFGRFGDVKKLRQETADREKFASELGKYVTSSERALRGGGVLGPKLLELLKPYYPNIGDTPEVIEKKFQALEEEIIPAYEAANLSLKYKAHIDPSELTKFKSLSKDNFQEDFQNWDNDSFSNTNNQTIPMIGPDGEIFDIPADKVSIAKTKGYKLMQ